MEYISVNNNEFKIAKPIIAILMSSLGRVLFGLENKLGIIVIIAALVLQIITLILSFIFCFSKNKKVVTQQNNAQ